MSSGDHFNTSRFSKWIIKPSEISWDSNKILGRGSYGTVYEGKCRGKEVAVKRLSRQIRPQNLQDLLAEVDTMSTLLHPNVLLFMGVCPELGNLMIVTELMTGGSLENILQKRKDLSLYQRIHFAKDAALGLNWLHCSNPPIVHRDIKLSNLLVDDTFHVKVCDFGFALPVSGEWCREEAKGSPLYMAPECLQGLPYNLKSDVYSFGLCLWELYTRDELFPHVQDEDTLVKVVCDIKERPPIPQDCPPRLATLMQRCWDAVPANRPSFTEILQEFDLLLIDVAIDEETAKEFWKKNLLSKDYIEWSSFTSILSQHLGNKEDLIGYRYLREVLLSIPQANDFKKEQKVSIELFGQAVKWFGPLRSKDNLKDNLVTQAALMAQKSSFHLKATKNDAEKMLMTKQEGSYLFRLSSEPGYYVLSMIDKHQKLLHFRIKYDSSTRKYAFDEKLYGSLDEFIEAAKHFYSLTTPIPSPNVLQMNPPTPYMDSLR